MRKLSLILLILISSLASAEESALLVSINNYQDDFGPLRYYVTNMEVFRDVQVETAGYKPKNIHLMADQMSGQDLPRVEQCSPATGKFSQSSSA